MTCFKFPASAGGVSTITLTPCHDCSQMDGDESSRGHMSHLEIDADGYGDGLIDNRKPIQEEVVGELLRMAEMLLAAAERIKDGSAVLESKPAAAI